MGKEGMREGEGLKTKGTPPGCCQGRKAGLPLTAPLTFLNYHSCLVCRSESSAFVSLFLAGEVAQLHSLWELHFQGRHPSQHHRGWADGILESSSGPTRSSFPCRCLCLPQMQASLCGQCPSGICGARPLGAPPGGSRLREACTPFLHGLQVLSCEQIC